MLLKALLDFKTIFLQSTISCQILKITQFMIPTVALLNLNGKNQQYVYENALLAFGTMGI